MILYALGTAWELHKPYFQKSGLLSKMVMDANERSLSTEMMSDSDQNEAPERQDGLSAGETYPCTDIICIWSVVRSFTYSKCGYRELLPYMLQQQHQINSSSIARNGIAFPLFVEEAIWFMEGVTTNREYV